jgi:hypothetical protein
MTLDKTDSQLGDIVLKVQTDNIVDELPPGLESLVCPICDQLPAKPVQLRCEHPCCRTCLEDALARYGECPCCRAPAKVEDIGPMPRITQSYLDQLKVRCDYDPSHVVTMDKLAHHIDMECPRPETCTQGCGAQGEHKCVRSIAARVQRLENQSMWGKNLWTKGCDILKCGDWKHNLMAAFVILILARMACGLTRERTPERWENAVVAREVRDIMLDAYKLGRVERAMYIGEKLPVRSGRKCRRYNLSRFEEQYMPHIKGSDRITDPYRDEKGEIRTNPQPDDSSFYGDGSEWHSDERPCLTKYAMTVPIQRLKDLMNSRSFGFVTDIPTDTDLGPSTRTRQFKLAVSAFTNMNELMYIAAYTTFISHGKQGRQPPFNRHMFATILAEAEALARKVFQDEMDRLFQERILDRTLDGKAPAYAEFVRQRAIDFAFPTDTKNPEPEAVCKAIRDAWMNRWW